MSDLNSLTELIAAVDDAEWVRGAACADLGVEAIDRFFVDAGGRLTDDTQQMCATCPVRTECLGHAVRGEINAGYFGGVSPTRRRALVS
ncbi:MAG TPA: WhiB family transcriptional regulator [Ilumatobacter sp.]|nr:WhiB family transcriptional regulator [Ilumatobacter sp.]